MRIDHLQLAIPPGAEDLCRPFWQAVGFVEIDKPKGLKGRGGLWFRHGAVELHLGVDPAFVPSAKAHPGFATPGLTDLSKVLAGLGAPVVWDDTIKGRRRFFTKDPAGNRIEFLED